MNTQEFTCSICGAKCTGFGNNPEPLLKYEERCCSECNNIYVIPARFYLFSDKKYMTEEIKKEVKKRIEERK